MTLPNCKHGQIDATCEDCHSTKGCGMIGCDCGTTVMGHFAQIEQQTKDLQELINSKPERATQRTADEIFT